MARISHIAKNKKREASIAKFTDKRDELREKMNNIHLPMEERIEARAQINKLPRMSMPNRLKTRCMISGNSRAVYKKFKMGRMAFRELANLGLIPGLKKASW